MAASLLVTEFQMQVVLSDKQIVTKGTVIKIRAHFEDTETLIYLNKENPSLIFKPLL